jgi:hypothetical protein
MAAAQGPLKKHGEAALLAAVETVVERLGGRGAGSSVAPNAPPMNGAKASTAAMATAKALFSWNESPPSCVSKRANAISRKAAVR